MRILRKCSDHLHNFQKMINFIKNILFSSFATRYAVIASGCASCPKLKCERPGCDTSFCYHCKQYWHPNQTCDTARAERAANQRSSSLTYSNDSGSHSKQGLIGYLLQDILFLTTFNFIFPERNTVFKLCERYMLHCNDFCLFNQSV